MDAKKILHHSEEVQRKLDKHRSHSTRADDLCAQLRDLSEADLVDAVNEIKARRLIKEASELVRELESPTVVTAPPPVATVTATTRRSFAVRNAGKLMLAACTAAVLVMGLVFAGIVIPTGGSAPAAAAPLETRPTTAQLPNGEVVEATAIAAAPVRGDFEDEASEADSFTDDEYRQVLADNGIYDTVECIDDCLTDNIVDRIQASKSNEEVSQAFEDAGIDVSEANGENVYTFAIGLNVGDASPENIRAGAGLGVDAPVVVHNNVEVLNTQNASGINVFDDGSSQRRAWDTIAGSYDEALANAQTMTNGWFVTCGNPTYGLKQKTEPVPQKVPAPPKKEEPTKTPEPEPTKTPEPEPTEEPEPEPTEEPEPEPTEEPPAQPEKPKDRIEEISKSREDCDGIWELKGTKTWTHEWDEESRKWVEVGPVIEWNDEWDHVRDLTPEEREKLDCDPKPEKPKDRIEEISKSREDCDGIWELKGTKTWTHEWDEESRKWVEVGPVIEWNDEWDHVRDLTPEEREKLDCDPKPEPEPLPATYTQYVEGKIEPFTVHFNVTNTADDTGNTETYQLRVGDKGATLTIPDGESRPASIGGLPAGVHDGSITNPGDGTNLTFQVELVNETPPGGPTAAPVPTLPPGAPDPVEPTATDPANPTGPAPTLPAPTGGPTEAPTGAPTEVPTVAPTHTEDPNPTETATGLPPGPIPPPNGNDVVQPGTSEVVVESEDTAVIDDESSDDLSLTVVDETAEAGIGNLPLAAVVLGMALGICVVIMRRKDLGIRLSGYQPQHR